VVLLFIVLKDLDISRYGNLLIDMWSLLFLVLEDLAIFRYGNLLIDMWSLLFLDVVPELNNFSPLIGRWSSLVLLHHGVLNHLGVLNNATCARMAGCSEVHTR
jgi:hypothetical protein